MSIFGSINPVNLAAQAALAAATGGTSLIASTAMRLMSSVGQQVIQQLGQKLGLPQGAIDLAQGAFCAEAGDWAGAASNASEAASDFVSAAGGGYGDQNDVNSAAQDTIKQLVDQANDAFNQSSADDSKANGKGKGGGDSFLVAFAKALAKTMDSKMQRMMDLSKQVDQQTQSANSSGKAPVISQMTAEISALGQEVGFISQALNNSVKSLGDAASTLARKS